MRLAICMIVKNEEACLAKCLDSIKGLGDLYVLDTGSIDKTCEIARRYTDKVFENEYKWNDSMCEARNYVLNKSQSDWILSIDADEYLISSKEDILKEIDKAEVQGFKTVDVVLKAERSDSVHYFPRLFKRGCNWKGAIHNYLDISESNKSNLVIVYGYSEAHKKDPDRAYRILYKEAQKPGMKRELFYLAREYWYRGKYEEAILWYKKYLKVGTWVPEMAEAYLMIAQCYVKLNKYVLARQHAVLAINLNADYKEALSFMGDLCGPKNSAKWYKWAYEATNENVLFVNDLRSARDIQLVKCIPDIFDHKSVLYVGANTHRQQILKDFRNHEYNIDIVEPFAANVEYCKLIPGIDNVYHSDIKSFAAPRLYDIVFWWHGPEHINRTEYEQTFSHMEKMASKYVVLSCPWGINPQDAIDNNNFEIHRTHAYEHDFRVYGYTVDVIGKKDTWNSNLIAWKKIGV